MTMGGLLTPTFDSDMKPSNMRIKISNTNRVFVKIDMGHMRRHFVNFKSNKIERLEFVYRGTIKTNPLHADTKKSNEFLL